MLKNCPARSVALLLCFGVFFSSGSLARGYEFADSPFIVNKWGTKEGLPQSSVFSIVQSRDGYLWLGTFGGLVRFDGVRFSVFGEGSLRGINSSSIVQLLADSRTNLWVGTEADGIMRIGSDGQIQNFDLGRGSREGRLISSCEDSGGAVWLLTAKGLLAHYEQGRMEVFPAGGRCVTSEKSGLLLLGTDGGIFARPQGNTGMFLQITPATRRFDFLLASQSGGYWRLADGRIEHWSGSQLERDFGNYPWGSNTLVNAACEDHSGNLIVGTQDAGVFWFDADGKATQISSEQGLSHTTVLSICVDQEGDLWVGTDGGGLNRVKRKRFRVLKISTTNTIPSTLTIPSVCADGHGGLWCGNPGWKLIHWTSDGLRYYDAAEGLENTYLRSVFVDREQRVWVGTARVGAADGGLFVLRGNRFERIPGTEEYNSIPVIYEDHAGALWFGSERGLVCWTAEMLKTYTTHEGLSGNSITAIAEDAEGNLWVGTERDGLNRFHDGKFTAFHKGENRLPSEKISSLLADTDGVLWIGTSAGLVRMQAGRWSHYTTRDGLATDSIGYITDDDQGNLWIGTFSGLIRVSKKSLNDLASGTTNTLACRVYAQADGLPTGECSVGSQPAAARTPDARLWFATVQGLISANPAELNPNPFRPPVVIESVLVGSHEQKTNFLSANPIVSVAVPPRQELVEIQYASLNVGTAERSHFRYRLDPGSAWTDAGDSRVVRFPNLRPGDYQFQVIACNEDGVWSDTGATLALTVLPPFWQTWWFLTLTIAVVIALIAGVVYYVSTQKLQRQLAGLRQKEALERERARIARDLHDELGANLMQVALLGDLAVSDKEQPQEIETHAKQISQTARETTKALDEIVWAANPSNDTLDGLITYTCKYAQEYFELAGIHYRLEVPTVLPDVTIAPDVRHNIFLAAKEAINNVVKHAHASTAWIRLRLEPEKFVLEIEDDGRGAQAAGEKTVRSGLKNMRKRMEDVGGEFSIGPAPKQGTNVRLTAPTVRQ